jgi:hypothetical protein
MLIRGYINQLCGQTPSDIRMGVPAPKINFVGLAVTLIETQHKAAINSKFQSGREPRELEDWLAAQPQRFIMLGNNDELWVTSQFSGPLNRWWLKHKQQAAIPTSFDSLVEEL